MINIQSYQTQQQQNHLLLSCIGCGAIGVSNTNKVALQHTSCCGQIICEDCRSLLCQSNGILVSNTHQVVEDKIVRDIQKSQQTQTILENLRNKLKSCNSCSHALRKKTIQLIEAPYLGIILDVITKQNQQGFDSDITNSNDLNDNQQIGNCARCRKSQLEQMYHCNTCNGLLKDQKQIPQQSQHARRLLFNQIEEQGQQQQEHFDHSSLLQKKYNEDIDTYKFPLKQQLLCSECSESIHSIGSFITHDIQSYSVEYLKMIASSQYQILQDQIQSAADALVLNQQKNQLHQSSSVQQSSSSVPIPSISTCNLHFGKPIKKICTFDQTLLCDSCIDTHRSNCIGNIASVEMAQRGMRESLLLGLQDIENLAASMHEISQGITERITELDIKMNQVSKRISTAFKQLHDELILKENHLISELRMQCLQVKDQYIQGKNHNNSKVVQQEEQFAMVKQLVLSTLQASPPLSMRLLQSQSYFNKTIAEIRLQGDQILSKEQGKQKEEEEDQWYIQEIVLFEKQLEELMKSQFQQSTFRQINDIIKGIQLNRNENNIDRIQTKDVILPLEKQFFMSKFTNIGDQLQQQYGNQNSSSSVQQTRNDISRGINMTMNNNSTDENNREFFSGLLSNGGKIDDGNRNNDVEIEEDSYEEAQARSIYQQQEQQGFTSTQANNNNSSYRSVSSNYMSEVSNVSSIASQQNNNNTEINNKNSIQGNDRQNSSTHGSDEMQGRIQIERYKCNKNTNNNANTVNTVNQLGAQEQALLQAVMTRNGSERQGAFQQNCIINNNNNTKSTPFQNTNSSSKSIGISNNNSNTNNSNVTTYLLQNTRISSFCENNEIEARQAYKGKINNSNNNSKSLVNQEPTNGSTSNNNSSIQCKTTTTTSLHNSSQDRQARDKTVSKNLSSVQSPTPPVRENSRARAVVKPQQQQQQQFTPVKRSPSVATQKLHSETSGKYSQGGRNNINTASTGLSAGKIVPKSLNDITDLLVNRDLLLFNTEIAKNPLAQRIIAKTYSTCTSIMLQWSHMSNLPADVKYVVEYGIGLKISGQEKFTRIYSGQEPSYVINKLQPKTTYRVRVCAIQSRKKNVKSQQDQQITTITGQQPSELPSSVSGQLNQEQQQLSKQQSLGEDKGSTQQNSYDSMTSSDYEFGDWSEIHSISTQEIQTFEGYECCSVSRKDKDITVQYDKPGLVISAYPYSYGRITWTITAIIDSHDCGEDINACLIVGVSSKGSRKQQAVIGSTVNYGLHREKFKVKVCLDMQRLVMVIVTPQQPNGETFNSLPNTPLFPAFHNKTNNRTSSLKLLVSFE